MFFSDCELSKGTIIAFLLIRVNKIAIVFGEKSLSSPTTDPSGISFNLICQYSIFSKISE